ncbi:MAG: HlyD family efflux transporter periplasmic adaptor subunit [Candidatus Cloacimonetes bacterium]|nr:HlyD family efflux transporter periplasmic adaptor subunit [Candidatus Cloacimonadota bacterium]
MPTESKETNQQITPYSNERCEEVQVIVDRMPTKGAIYIAVIVSILVVIAFTLSCIISYPDTVDGNISLTAGAAPIRLVAKVNGQLQLYHKDGDIVQRKELLASIQNAAVVKDVLELETLLYMPFDTLEYGALEPLKNSMGEISDVFNQYLLALNLFKQHLESDLYTTAIINLQSQIASDRQILRHVNAGREISRDALNLSSKELYKDSLLFAHKAITEQDLDKQRTSYLNAFESFWNTESNGATVQARINKNEIEIKRVNLEQNETREKLLSDALGKRSNLLNQIFVWKERYLLISPIAGELEFLGFWRNYCFVEAGKDVLSIIPKQNGLFGEVRIPAFGAGKVKIGQLVNVKINNYPYDEYGLLKGEIKRISKIPSQFKTKDGDVDSYLAIVNFPNGAVTNYGITLNIDFESKGTAEIITKNKKLIERLFDNLKSLGTK